MNLEELKLLAENAKNVWSEPSELDKTMVYSLRQNLNYLAAIPPKDILKILKRLEDCEKTLVQVICSLEALKDYAPIETGENYFNKWVKDLDNETDI